MKPGASFINTARESLVDEAELAEALRRGHLSGAALDVVERPAGGARHPLLDLPERVHHPAHRRRNPGDAGPRRTAGSRRYRRDASGPAAVGRRESRGLRRRREWPAMSASYLLAIDAGTGSCRALLFTREGRAGRRQLARVDPPRAAGRARRPGLRRPRQLAGDRRLHQRRARPGWRHRRRRARGRGDQHARGHRAVRRRRPRDLGLPERRLEVRAGSRRADRRGRGRAHLRSRAATGCRSRPRPGCAGWPGTAPTSSRPRAASGCSATGSPPGCRECRPPSRPADRARVCSRWLTGAGRRRSRPSAAWTRACCPRSPTPAR